MNTNKTLSIWNNGFGPLSELRQEMDRMFDSFYTPSTNKEWRNSDLEWHPACDVVEDEGHFLLTVEIPGVTKDQVRLGVIENQILISGERRQEHKKKFDGAYYTERRYGKFHRSFMIPSGVDTDKIEASFQNGMLKVFVPKAESAKARQINISSANNSTGLFAKFLNQSNTKDKKEEVTA